MNAPPADRALALADAWQRDFPLESRPFQRLADDMQADESQVLNDFAALRENGILVRIGAVFRPNTIGASTLAAMAVPAERLEAVAAIVSAEPAVNHNYEREHRINLWFVVTAEDQPSLDAVLQRIEHKTGLAVLSLPLEQPYHIDLSFSVTRPDRKTRIADQKGEPVALDEVDRRLLAAIESGLPLVAAPYAALADAVGVSEATVIAHLERLISDGAIARFGCVLRHRQLGYRANAMAVWDVPDDQVDAAGQRLAQQDGVTLCYRRARRLPDWPYNLFVMVHGREREAVRGRIDEVAAAAGLSDLPAAVLFSLRCFKQRGARYRSSGAEPQ